MIGNVGPCAGSADGWRSVIAVPMPMLTARPGPITLRRKGTLFGANKNQYWTSRLAAESRRPNPRLLWRSMDSVLCRGKDSGLPTAAVPHSADNFQRFFEANVQAVRSSMPVYATAAAADSASGAFSRPASSPSLTVWREVTEDEVRCIVLAAPAKSCSLDPIPTFLLRDCIDSVAVIFLDCIG